MFQTMLRADILLLEIEAEADPRRRKARVLSQPEGAVQRLVNALAPGSYSCPHRFRGTQTIACLNGRLAAILWDAEGVQDGVVKLEKGDVLDLIEPAPYHALVAYDGPVTILETLTGPYRLENREDLPGFPVEVGKPGGAFDEEIRRQEMLRVWVQKIKEYSR